MFSLIWLKFSNCVIINTLQLLFVFGINFLLNISPFIFLSFILSLVSQTLIISDWLSFNYDSRTYCWRIRWDFCHHMLLWSSLSSYPMLACLNGSLIHISLILKVNRIFNRLINLINIINILLIDWATVCVVKLFSIPWSLFNNNSWETSLYIWFSVWRSKSFVLLIVLISIIKFFQICVIILFYPWIMITNNNFPHGLLYLNYLCYRLLRFYYLNILRLWLLRYENWGSWLDNLSWNSGLSGDSLVDYFWWLRLRCNVSCSINRLSVNFFNIFRSLIISTNLAWLVSMVPRWLLFLGIERSIIVFVILVLIRHIFIISFLIIIISI